MELRHDDDKNVLNPNEQFVVSLESSEVECCAKLTSEKQNFLLSIAFSVA